MDNRGEDAAVGGRHNRGASLGIFLGFFFFSIALTLFFSPPLPSLGCGFKEEDQQV